MEWHNFQSDIQEAQGFNKVYQITKGETNYWLKWFYYFHADESNLVGYFKDDYEAKQVAEFIERG